ncbi:hypothetical protein ANN_09731 [Periplaneta americana]|uniref:Uncharacterized protein n=1 Tax=Periplaneta americana TaxID=6978 RepID=A0ABQ8TPE8_PERAM|nr:hypothetical protein ANN_09731 [Periplaneta americana]
MEVFLLLTSLDCTRIIHRGWTQSSNCVAHPEERPPHEKTAACWVSHNLTETQKWHRYAIAQLPLQRYHNEGDVFLKRIVAIDEMWAWAYEPELKRQSNLSDACNL